MSTTSNHLTDPHCSSSPLWDVFLSFAGKDTRKNFISHLYKALDQQGIETFMDDPELQKGEEISSGLLKAIHGSKMFIVVISENYASSSWCLDELIEILGCKRTNGQVVVPVFCYVDPSTVRYQKGSFGEALERHKNRHSVDMVEEWKSALAEIAEISGYHLKKETDAKESDTIQEIVEHVARQTSTYVLHTEEHLYGIDSAVEEIYQKLRMESNDVRAIGIWGMGGIGKTTTAKVFYNKYSKKFDISCFIEDIKQNSQGGSTLLSLLEQLLIELLKRKDYKVLDVESGIRRLKKILSSNRVLIVLDDLDQSSYWKLLVRLCNFFSAGSRIMITTRDEKMLNQLKVHMSEVEVYKLKELGQKESLRLFSYHAFGKTMPAKSFRDLSLSFVSYTGGLPLALMVLGSSLCGSTCVSFWKAKLEKVRQIPDDDIQKVLQLSYNELSDEEKAIFLDIVFFFVGKDKDEAVHIFKSCHFFPDVGIPILVQRCLLIIDKSKRFKMHDLIQDMGREVIRGESKHGKCKRLYLGEGNAFEALQNVEGAEQIEGLILNLSKSTNKRLSAKIFEKLPKLRLLQITDAHDINGNFKNLFPELRCMRWHYCPWACLPSCFRPHKLVSLDMPFSKFKTLWKGAMSQVNLKSINVSYSKNLKKTPNLKNANTVENLTFCGCTSLQKVHPTIKELANLGHLDLSECNQLIELPDTIGQLGKLGQLDMSDCVKLKRLPNSIKQLTILSSLDMNGCHILKRLPEQLGDIKGLKKLDASYTAIEKLPDSITHLKELVRLDLSGCNKLKKLPEQFGNLEGLEIFNAGDSALEELPDSFVCLINLAQLYLHQCKSLIKLPDKIWKLKLLKRTNLGGCSKLERLPEQIGKLQCLKVLDAYSTAIEELPDSIGLLSMLEVLNLSSCTRLTYLPNSTGNLTSLETLSLGMCSISLWLPAIPTFCSLKELCLSDEGQSFSNQEDIKCKSFGSSLPKLPLTLERLYVYDHATLEQLPDLSSYEQLRELDIRRCSSLKTLSLFPPHLEVLYVCECPSLRSLPDLSLLKEMKFLRVTKCSNLKSVSLKQSSLQVGPDEYSSFTATIPNMEIAEWFTATIPNREIAEWLSYKSSGCTLSFDFPPILGDNFLGVALWVVYKFKSLEPSYIRAVITNKTEGITKNYDFLIGTDVVGKVQSSVKCLRGEYITVKNGDRINVSFQSLSFSSRQQVVGNHLEVEKCGAHVIQNISFGEVEK